MSDRVYTERACWARQGARIAFAASLVLLAGSVVRPARAEPGQTTWTTYLRAGPGPQYAVIDEVESGSPLDVQACRDGWCRVEFGRAFGYVMAGVVETHVPSDRTHAAPESNAPAAQVPCFQTRHSGYGVGDQLQFCIH